MILEYPKIVLEAINKMPQWFKLLRDKKFRNRFFGLVDSLTLSGQGYLIFAKFNPVVLGIVALGSMVSMLYESTLDKELKSHIKDIINLKNQVEKYKATANFGRI